VSVSVVVRASPPPSPCRDDCDPDDDGDAFDDATDNCPGTANPEQEDNDTDGDGDDCDVDDDNDGVVDPGLLTPASVVSARAIGAEQFTSDNCQFVPNANQENTDGDAMGDACDPGTCASLRCCGCG
jgi:hypothetical protein